MPYYQNSIIYKLSHCNDLENENIYIGSTTNFTRRKHQHKLTCNNENYKDYNLKIYKFIRDNGGWNEWQMIPIEVFPCNNKKDLEVRERYHIELLKSKLNKNIPTRTDKEYYDDNKNLILKNNKEWRDNNKDKKKEIDKIWCENNKEKIKKKRDDNNNKEKAKKRSKEHYKNNKDEINEKRKEKVTCQCGSIVRKGDIKRHEKSLKHKNFILALNKE